MYFSWLEFIQSIYDHLNNLDKENFITTLEFKFGSIYNIKYKEKYIEYLGFRNGFFLISNNNFIKVFIGMVSIFNKNSYTFDMSKTSYLIQTQSNFYESKIENYSRNDIYTKLEEILEEIYNAIH
jgi:hypothetical protein